MNDEQINEYIKASVDAEKKEAAAMRAEQRAHNAKMDKQVQRHTELLEERNRIARNPDWRDRTHEECGYCAIRSGNRFKDEAKAYCLRTGCVIPNWPHKNASRSYPERQPACPDYVPREVDHD